MDITLDKSSATEGIIKVKISEDDYAPKVDEKVKEYKKKANIKGFRPGKVPASLIKKMYGKSIIADELNHILSHSLSDYIKEQNLKIIGEPLPNQDKNAKIDLDNQTEFEFEYEVGLVDDFAYDLKKKVTKYEIKVDKKTTDDHVEDIKNQYGEMSEPDQIEDGDFIYGDLNQVEGDIERSTVISTTEIDKKAKEKWIGSKVNDEIIFDIRKTFKDDSIIALVVDKKKEEVKDIKGDFSFKITKINRRKPAELNQEFYDKMFGEGVVKSKEEFREKIEESIGKNYEQESEKLLVKKIQDKLIEDTKIEIPDSFFKKWIKTVNKEEVTDEQLEKDYENYVKELKWTLIRNKIAEDHEIKVENEDVTEKAREIIKNYLLSSGMPPDQLGDSLDKFVENYLQAENGKNYMNIYDQVKNDKLIDHIKTEITINSKKVTLEEFKEKAL